MARPDASRARRVSARPPYATSATVSSVAGLVTASVRPLSALHHLPSISILRTVPEAVAVAMAVAPEKHFGDSEVNLPGVADVSTAGGAADDRSGGQHEV